MNEPLADGNIQLTYRMKIYPNATKNTVFIADGAEVFKDEHGVQWIKFFAKNGYEAGLEHILRTDRVLVVRES